MAKATKWRRDLTRHEDNESLIKLEERWNISEEVYVEEMQEVVRKVIEKLLADVTKLLENEDIRGLNDIRMGYRDKLVNIVKGNLFNSYRIGKAGVFDELEVKKEVVFGANDKAYLISKSEAIVDDMLGRTKSNTVFTCLAGIRARQSIKQIISIVKGDPYGRTGQ